jgi:folate-binding protein YgfZ
MAVAAEHATQVRQRLEDAGAVPAGPAILDLVRVLQGWPRLGTEINEKTLPQEVRFDELEGVSYTKGCYTGQETVARVHFRGHANKRLVGLLFDEDPDATSNEITHEGEPMGRVTTIAWANDGLGYVGLGMLRSKIPVGKRVRAANAEAVVADFPLTQHLGSLVG